MTARSHAALETPLHANHDLAELRSPIADATTNARGCTGWNGSAIAPIARSCRSA
jgi:hypothetical protein